ncbi:hypothetical protein JAAARDRAFT_49398 [Jaapia argillacea MUCL 33604]|uniref:Uncharacterized protein n=1 Tax=Jaapia argillacea MUCL 33604 TaxID=933084 RepID=A0A067PRU1_9AGAM|nr:hypothetical protein JAAARDRAFT_49398 [Jaapia argillacea MUCL 33604]
MSTTSITTGSPPTSPPRRHKRAPVPLLLSSFPTPPTFIPNSPLPTTPLPPSGSQTITFPSVSSIATPLVMPPTPSTPNPPPSRPPSLPLPPVPGPSPISEQETLAFMSNRSRRASKISTTSSIYSTLSSTSASRRDSVASSASNRPTSPSISASFARRESVASFRSFASSNTTGSLPIPHHHPHPRSPRDRSPKSPILHPVTNAISISEEDVEEITRASMAMDSSEESLELLMAGDEGGIDKALGALKGAVSTSPLMPSVLHRAKGTQDGSLSSISMKDLPVSDVEADEPPPRQSGPSIDQSAEAALIHLQMRAERSKSDRHKDRLAASVSSAASTALGVPRVRSDAVGEGTVAAGSLGSGAVESGAVRPDAVGSDRAPGGVSVNGVANGTAALASSSKSRASPPLPTSRPSPTEPKKSSLNVPPSRSSHLTSSSKRPHQVAVPVPAARSDSPDIKDILEKTPKPRRKASSSNLTGSGSGTPGERSRSVSRVRKARGSDGALVSGSGMANGAMVNGMGRRKSEGSVLIGGHSHEEAYATDAMLPGPDESFEDYGVVVKGKLSGLNSINGSRFGSVNGHTAVKGGLDVESLSKALDGFSFGDGASVGALSDCGTGVESGSGSDSEIDIHTPLPHLMLRDGLLSPNSKLLPGMTRTPSPMMTPDGRPGSVFSTMTTASVMTKSGIFKDERDTQRRRVRHRDGRLLKGGLGLTTGLGWSDSEDEDAPSPLTRRLSSMALSRQSSNSSVRSAPHPLSRSYSGPVSASTAIIDDKKRTKPRSSLPPTSWQHRTSNPTSNSHTTGADSRSHSRKNSANSNWSVGALSIPENGTVESWNTTGSFAIPSEKTKGRTSVTSDVGSRRPSESGSYRGAPSSEAGGKRRTSDSASVRREREESNSTLTPSTASTVGMPLTPIDSSDHGLAYPNGSLGKGKEREKALPALPTPKKMQSNASLKSSVAVSRSSGGSGIPSGLSAGSIPRPRTISSSSATSSVAGMHGHGQANGTMGLPGSSFIAQPPPTPALPSPSFYRSPSTPRPLHLAQAHSQPGDTPQKSATGTGSVLGYNRNIHNQQKERMRSSSTPKPILSSTSSLPSLSRPTSSMDSPAKFAPPPSPVPPLPSPRPKPRTGAGMVYRTSSHPGSGPATGGSRLRMPSSMGMMGPPASPRRTHTDPNAGIGIAL